MRCKPTGCEYVSLAAAQGTQTFVRIYIDLLYNIKKQIEDIKSLRRRALYMLDTPLPGNASAYKLK